MGQRTWPNGLVDPCVWPASVISQLNQEFAMKDLGRLYYILGIEVQ